MIRFLSIVLLAAVGAGIVFAHHDAERQSSGQTQALPVSPRTGKGTGVIQQINQGKGAVTIKHGPLQGIVIRGMTMSFPVSGACVVTGIWPTR